MDFLTSTIISGIVYDVLKKGALPYYDLAKHVLSNFTNDEKLFNSFAEILEESDINEKSSINEIINKIDANNRIENIIQTIHNTHIYGDNNTINNYYTNEKKKNFILQKINEKFRNLSVDAIFATSILYANFYFLSYFCLGITIIFIVLYLTYLPQKFPVMYVQVHEDRLIYLFKKVVMYDDIKNFKPHNSHFMFRTDKALYKTIVLYKNDYADFIHDAVKRYSIATDTLLD